MAKAFAFISNTTAQAFTASPSTVNPGAATHGFGGTGCSNLCKRTIEVNGTAITLNASGYYTIDVGATVTNSEAGNVTLSLYQDGALVASGASTIAAAAEPANIAFPAGVKVACNATSTLTLVTSSSAGTPTVENVYTTVEKM